ncbi:MAG: hypothetical protein U1E66_08695 [Rhodospirillales bacterium]
MRYPLALLCLVAATTAAAAEDAPAGGDRLAGFAPLDEAALAVATGGFRIGNLEIGLGAVIRTTIADGAGADRVATDAFTLEPGTPAGVYRLQVPGTTVTGRGLAGVIENTESHRAISREVTLNVEIAGLASAIRAAAAARTVGAAGPASRFR